MNSLPFLRLKQLAFVSVTTALLSACGGSGSTPSTTPAPPAAPPAEEPAPPAEGPSAEAMPLTRAATNIGDAYVGVGNAEVLLPGATDGTFETAVEDREGRTLYVFDNDAVGTSACTSTGCVTNWPPLLADEGVTAELPLTIIDRGDGNRQWALRDKPLYFFLGDTAIGQTNGEGVGDVWHVAVSQPVSLNDDAASAAENDYLVGYGETLVSSAETEGVTDAYVAERKNMEGFSLYTFDNDENGVSNCFGSCLTAWPALLAEDGETASAPYSLIERQMNTEGGTAMQWALNGKPLYYFSGDSLAAQTNGTSVPNWRLARPEYWKLSNTSRSTALVGAGLVMEAVPNNGVEETSSIAKDGFSLYTFDNDSAGVSTCVDNCLTNWPALMAPEGAVAIGPYTLITRDSGELQWALNDLPLYFFAGDTAAGEVNGDELGGVWHLARRLPVVANTLDPEGVSFAAHGDLIDRDGNADDTFQDFTLYIFTDDDQGVSTCFGNCENIWPPLFADQDAQDFGDFTVVDRNDPSTADDDSLNLKQWAFKGLPLYFFGGDAGPGDVQGEYGTWFIAKPSTAASSAASNSDASTGGPSY